MSPIPWPNTISAGTHESEQPSIIAKGFCHFCEFSFNSIFCLNMKNLAGSKRFVSFLFLDAVLAVRHRQESLANSTLG
jgi:hypothetical protein